MIVHHDLGRAPCVRPVIVWAEALFAEQRDIIAGVLLGPQRGQLGPLPSLAPDVAFAPKAVIPRSSSHFVKGIGGISENMGRGSLMGDWLAYSYPNLDRRFGMLRS